MKVSALKTETWLDASALVAAAVSVAIGTTGMVGWISGSPLLLSFTKRSFPLQFNTAVCILALGIGAAAVRRRKLLAVAAAGVVLTVATLCGIDILLGGRFAVPAMFFDGSGGPLRQASLAPNSVIALALAAVALIGLAIEARWRAGRTIAAVLAAAIAAVGAIPMTGYALGLSTAYTWAEQTPMSLPAAMGVFAFAMAVILHAWSCERRGENRFPGWVAAAVLTGFATASTLLFSALQLDRSLTRQWNAEITRTVHINTLTTLGFGLGVSAALSAVLWMARRMYAQSCRVRAANIELDDEVRQRDVAQQRVERLNQALQTISACRQAIAHAADAQDLLDRICAIAVKAGGYRLVWIGFAEHDQRKTVRPVAKSGIGTDYMVEGAVTWADEPRGRGPTGLAIRTGRPARCADTLADESFLPWRERAVLYGFRSSLVVPLLHGSEAYGAVSIYSDRTDSFDDEEVNLFSQLADDLTFGIDSLRARVEREHAEAELERSEHRYRALTSATAQIVWLTDPNGLVHTDMPTWREFTGMSIAQIQGWGWLDAVHPEDRDRTAKVWSDAVQGRALYETEYRILRSDKQYRHVWVRGVPVVEASGAIREWVGTCTDITERKRAQEDLARYAQELERSNSELQEFAFVASHDLQEPLRKITAFSERLRDRSAGQLDETCLDYLHRMHNSAMRMARLIDSLLEYSRLTTRALPFEEVDLATTCVGVVADLEQRIRETGARVTVRALPCVVGDPVQLRQLLQNLLANALKFHAPAARPEVCVSALRREGRWQLRVSDNGIGFDPQFAGRIFRPFQRLHGRNEYEGSGMGLAICRKIVQRHGATIEVETQPGQGATFIVSFPPLDAGVGARDPEYGTASSARGPKRGTPSTESPIVNVV